MPLSAPYLLPDVDHLPVVLVLASGRGERFLASGGSTHKLQADLGGRTVLQRTLDAVATPDPTDGVFLVTGAAGIQGQHGAREDGRRQRRQCRRTGPARLRHRAGGRGRRGTRGG